MCTRTKAIYVDALTSSETIEVILWVYSVRATQFRVYECSAAPSRAAPESTGETEGPPS